RAGHHPYGQGSDPLTRFHMRKDAKGSDPSQSVRPLNEDCFSFGGVSWRCRVFISKSATNLSNSATWSITWPGSSSAADAGSRAGGAIGGAVRWGIERFVSN